MPSRSETKTLRALRRRKGREESGLFLAEGPRVVGELLASPLGVRLLLHTADCEASHDGSALLAAARSAGIRCEEVAERALAELADTESPQGVLAMAEIPPVEGLPPDPHRCLLLDGVQDPGNAGTLIRTAEALAVDSILVLPGTVDPWNPKVVRAAAGSTFRLPPCPAAWDEVREWSRRTRLELWAADPGGEPLGRPETVPPRLGLVLGNEGGGLSSEARRAARRVVAIGMPGRTESLNVAVAGAILLDRLFGGGRES